MLEEQPLWVNSLNHNLSLLSLIGAVLLVAWIVVTITKKDNALNAFIAKYALWIGTGATLVGIFFTLFYSEYLHFPPCDLCWFQRIFLYPQFFMFALALFVKDRKVFLYSALLSFIGMVIALYHEMLQMGYDMYKPCSTAPFAVDCSKPTFVEFGFVTFPFMAAVLFAFLLVLSFVVYRAKK